MKKGDRAVVLVTHSMGSIMTLAFLNRQSQVLMGSIMTLAFLNKQSQVLMGSIMTLAFLNRQSQVPTVSIPHLWLNQDLGQCGN